MATCFQAYKCSMQEGVAPAIETAVLVLIQPGRDYFQWLLDMVASVLCSVVPASASTYVLSAWS